MEKTIMPVPVSGTPKKEKYIAPKVRIHTKVAVKVLCMSKMTSNQLNNYGANSWDETPTSASSLSSYDGVAF